MNESVSKIADDFIINEFVIKSVGEPDDKLRALRYDR